MPPKKARKTSNGDKAKDDKPTVKTRAMARKEKHGTAVAAPGGAPAKGAGKTVPTKPAAKPAAKPVVGVKRKRQVGDDGDDDSYSSSSSNSESESESVGTSDSDDDAKVLAKHWRGLCDDRLDQIEEALRAVGRELYPGVILPEHKSTETRRKKRANDKLPDDVEVDPLTMKKRKSKHFPHGFVAISFEELGEMAKSLSNLLAAKLAKRRIPHPKAKGLDPKDTKTLTNQWNNHGLKLRELLDLCNHNGPAVEASTPYALKKKLEQYGLNPIGRNSWELERAILLYELAGKQRLYDLPQDIMEKIKSALEGVEAPEGAANPKKMDEGQRVNTDNDLMNEGVVTVTSDGRTQHFTQVNVSGGGLRCMWHAIQEIWLGVQRAPGHGPDQRYPVNARVADLWENVMHAPDGTTNPARLSRRALYRAMQHDSRNNAYDDALEDRIYSLSMGDIDMVQLVADALDVEIFTYTPQHESDGTTSWNRAARGQPQIDPRRQIHIANYMHAVHWTALRPVGPFALPALDPVARIPNFSVPPPGPLTRLPIGDPENSDIRPAASHDNPEDGHVADSRRRDLAEDETEEVSEEEGEEEDEEEEYEQGQDNDQNNYEESDEDDNTGGNGGEGSLSVASQTSARTPSSASSYPNFASILLSAPPMFSYRKSSSQSIQSSRPASSSPPTSLSNHSRSAPSTNASTLQNHARRRAGQHSSKRSSNTPPSRVQKTAAKKYLGGPYTSMLLTTPSPLRPPFPWTRTYGLPTRSFNHWLRS